jgi:hypothetical protein
VFLSFLWLNAFQRSKIKVRLGLFYFEHDLNLSQEGKKVFLILGKEIRLNLSQVLIGLSVLDFIKNVFDELNMMMGFRREGFLGINNRFFY